MTKSETTFQNLMKQYGGEDSPPATSETSQGEGAGYSSNDKFNALMALYTDEEYKPVRDVRDWGKRYTYVTQAIQKHMDSVGDGYTTDLSGGYLRDLDTLITGYDSIKDVAGKYGLGREYVDELKNWRDQLQQGNEFMSQFENEMGYNNWLAEQKKALVGWNDPDSEYAAGNEEARQQIYADNQDKIAQAQQAYEIEKQRNDRLYEQLRIMREDLGDSWEQAYSEDVVKQIKTDIDTSNKALKEKKRTLEALETENRKYEYSQGKMDPYYALTKKADFGTVPTEYGNPGIDDVIAHDAWMEENEDKYREDFVDTGAMKIPDKLGLWLSASDAQKQGQAYSGQWAEIASQAHQDNWDRLTPSEVNIYYYLMYHDGQKAAYQFLDGMGTELNRRATAEMEKKVDAAGGWEDVGMNLLSVPANVLGGTVAYLDDLGRQMAGKDINPYSKAHTLQNYGQAVRRATSKDIVEAIGGDEGSFRDSAGQFASNTYQAIMSGVDSAAGAALMGRGYTMAMGMGAAANRGRELYEQGASRKEIALGAVGSGVIEALFEYVSLDKYAKNFLESDTKGWKDFIMKALVQGGVEASEETFTELGNLVWDAVVRGYGSDNQQLIHQMMLTGMTEQEARAEADKQKAMEVFWAAYGGFVSGGGMAVVGGGPKMIMDNQRVKQMYGSSADALVQEALELDPKNKTAQRLAKKLEAGKQLTGAELRGLVAQNDAAIAKLEENGQTEQMQEATDGQELKGQELPTLEEMPGNTNVSEDTEMPEGLRLRAVDDDMGGMDNGSDEIRERIEGRNRVSDGGKQRNAGTGTGEQTGQVDRGAEKARAFERQRERIQRQNLGKDLRKISSNELGLNNGTDEPTVKIYPEELWDDHLRATAARIYDETNKQVTFVLGAIQVRGRNGATARVRGVYTNDQIIVRADHSIYSEDQIADHEAYHAKAEMLTTLNFRLEERIKEEFSREEFDRVLDKYLAAMRGIYDVEEAESLGDYEKMLAMVREEMLADAYAGINAFGAGADRFTETVNGFMDENFVGKQKTEGGQVQKTGPPEGKYSYDEETARAEETEDKKRSDRMRELQQKKDSGVISVGEDHELGQLETLWGEEEGEKNARKDERYSQRYLGAAENQEIIDFVNHVASGNFKANEKVYLGNITSENAAKIREMTGINVDGFRVAIEARQIEHILKRHGPDGSADHSMADFSDISKIEFVMNNYDSLVVSGKTQAYTYMRDGRNRTADTVLYTKDIGGRVYYAVQAVPDTKAKTLYIVTAYIGAKEKGASQLIDAKSSNATSENGSVVTPETSIRNSNRNVNSEKLDNQSKIKSETEDIGTFDRDNLDIRYSVDDQMETGRKDGQQEEQRILQKQESIGEEKGKAELKPAGQESRPTMAKRQFRQRMTDLFSIPAGKRGQMGSMVDSFAERVIRNGELTEQDRKAFFDRMYESGMMTVPADEYKSMAREYIRGGKIYVNPTVAAEFGDDWQGIRKRAFGAGILLTNQRTDKNGQPNAGIDSWNDALAADIPGLFDSEQTDLKAALERIIQVAEEGRDEHVSLEEYTRRLAMEQGTSEDEYLDNMERQMDWALRTLASEAGIEMKVKEATNRKLERDRAERKELAEKQRQRKELAEQKKRTLKVLQWLHKNRNRAPEDLKAAFDEVLGDIDIYAAGAANEMNYSDKYHATWKNLADMYDNAQMMDPNFLPSKELEKIVARVRNKKLESMSIDDLNDLYQAAVCLQTEYHNRKNVIADENNRLFSEVYTDSKREIENAPGGYKGSGLDTFFNLEQLTPMNVLQRMVGWNPNSEFFGMAKQLERGERDLRAYTVKANRMLADFLTENEDWVKRADGQGEDAIWYEIEVPKLLQLRMGDQPIFGETVKVYMTPAQKVHMYLESKNYDNLRHMTGGRTFVNKELYSKGKRQEALAQGTTIRLAPETVKSIVSDLTPEEMELAGVLEKYYNQFATGEINRVSNVLYGYDKAMGRNYAPIYTNQNYTQGDFGTYDVTAEGVGNLKERTVSSNPSYNISAFDAFEKHVDRTARFVGMAIPARNWTTFMNWREESNSTGDIITHKWGQETKRYIEDLLAELQGGGTVEKETKIKKTADKIMSNYISAVFGANPSIVLKQLGSIPMAAPYLGAENIPSLSQLRDIDRELIGKYTQDLEWRTMGYAMPETKILKDNPGWRDSNKFFQFTIGGGAITAMDGWAASTLWPWAENKVRREHPELEVGTQQQIDNGESPFYKKVAEEFEYAVARSQSTTNMVNQSTMRKSNNPVVKAFTLFRSDSAQTYNTIRQMIGQAQYIMKNGGEEQQIKAAKAAAGSAFCAALLGYCWAEGVELLMNLWKQKGKKYRDEDDELTAKSIAAELTKGVVSDMAGVITGGQELYEIVGNIITGEKWYGIDVPGIEQVNDVLEKIMESGGGMRDLISGAVNVAKNNGDLGQYFKKHSRDVLGNIKSIAQTAATYVSGLPAANLEAYLLGPFKWIAPELEQRYQDLFHSVNRGSLRGMTGGSLQSRVERILTDRNVSREKGTAEVLTGLYEAGYTQAVPGATPEKIYANGEEQGLDEYHKQVYENTWSRIAEGAVDELVASESFRKAEPEMQEKMLNGIYNYATELTKAEMFDGYSLTSTMEKRRETVEDGATLAECIQWDVITDGATKRFLELKDYGISIDQFKEMYDAYREIGKSEKKAGQKATEFAHWVDSQKYSEKQKSAIKDEFGYYSQIRGETKQYDKMLEGGMSRDTALEVSEELSELKPEAGEKDVSWMQKWRVCVEFSNDPEDQMTALYAVASEDAYAKVEIAYSLGVMPEMYLRLHEIKEKFDANGNGSFSNSEIRAACDSMEGVSRDQKAVLWQLITGSMSARSNPYNRQLGDQVVKEREKIKEAKKEAEKKEKEKNTDLDVSFSDAVIRQLMGG